ncbi:MAG: hypothetical protein IVW57_14060 [Ktedonobacterales bacterium]|nr:hypothetical protein [Ktedonobacterales bacterium]
MSRDDMILPLPPISNTEGCPHVYVVNSDSAFLEMIADLLTDTRAQVTLEQLRPNPEITVANLRSAQPDLLLLDLIPFHRDAALLLERLELEPTLRELPVILASTSPSSAERLANEHADLVRDVLPKPFDLDDFFTLLGRVVVGLRVP